MKIYLNLPSKELVSQVVANRSNKRIESDKPIIGECARNLELGSGKSLRRAELENSSYRGINMLMRVRTECINYTNQLLRTLKLNISLLNSCVCCKEKVKEDIEHLIFDCCAFTDLREIHIPYVINSSIEKSALLKTHLGGPRQASSGRKTPREVLDLIEYLSRDSPRRLSFIAASPL